MNKKRFFIGLGISFLLVIFWVGSIVVNVLVLGKFREVSNLLFVLSGISLALTIVGSFLGKGKK